MKAPGSQGNPFATLYQRGYRSLIPIVPPGATISPHSDLARRRNTIGKIPGRLNGAGWEGFNWRAQAIPTTAEIERWSGWGASAGLATGVPIDDAGHRLIGIDIDCTNHLLADAAKAIVRRVLGPAPERIGRPPKSMLVYATLDDIPYARVAFADREDAPGGKPPHKVELSSRGRQFVAAGVHPDTGKRYSWPDGLPPAHELTVVDTSLIAAVMAEIAEAMPAASSVRASALETEPVDQEHLRAPTATAALAALAVLPNTPDLFPTRDSYIDVAYAIRAATGPEHEAAARAGFIEWAMKYEGDPGNTEHEAGADFDRCGGPYRIGAKWLFEQARTHGGYNDAALWFDELPEDEPTIFDGVVNPEDRGEDSGRFDHMALWEQELPEQGWIVDGLIPDNEVTLLYGDGGTGKTLLAQMLATAAATGRSWLGLTTKPVKVACFLCEDDRFELGRRQKAINKLYGVEIRDTAGLMFFDRKHRDNILALMDPKTGEARRTRTLQQLIEDSVGFGAGLVIVDTIADTFGGNENDRQQVRQYIQAALGQIVKRTGGAVLALGHPSLSGLATGRGGSTAWSNTVRSRLHLKPHDDKPGPYRVLEVMKANRAATGSSFKLRWSDGVLKVESAKMMTTEHEPSVFIPTTASRAEAAVIAALDALAGAELAMSLSPRAGNYAPKVLKAHAPAGLLDAISTSEVEAAVAALARAGTVVEDKVGRNAATRKAVYGLRLVSLPGAGAEDDPFDE